MKKNVFSWKTKVWDFETMKEAKDWINHEKQVHGGKTRVNYECWTRNSTFGGDKVYTVEMQYSDSDKIPSGW